MCLWSLSLLTRVHQDQASGADLLPAERDGRGTDNHSTAVPFLSVTRCSEPLGIPVTR